MMLAFVAGLVIASVLGGAMAWTTMRRFHTIEVRFQDLPLEEFRLMRGLRSRASQLHSAAMRFALTQEPAHRERLVECHQELDAYLAVHFSQWEHLPLLKDLEAHLDGYLAAAAAMSEAQDPMAVVERLLRNMENLRLTLDQIGEMFSDLGEARIDTLRRDLHEYHASVNDLEITLLASLGLLMLTAAALWWLATRAFILPLQADLTQAREQVAAKEGLAQVGAMAAAVVHEIRNPITTIRARNFALGGLLEKHPAAQKQARAIEEQIDRLERLSEEFLAFARPSDSKLEEIKIDAFLLNIKGSLEDEVTARGARFHLGPVVEDPVLMDPGQIAQVLTNLIRNAVEALPPTGGEVWVSATSVDGHVRISVKDDGPGIPEDMRPHLFTPFKTSKQRGSGLGLSISKNLVHQHGGDLKVESRPGHGAVFHVELPRVV